VGRVTGGRSQGDGYEELRQKGRKKDVLQRSRDDSKKRGILDGDDDHGDLPRKKHRTNLS